jgi:acyl-CoA thioesterase-1
MGSEDVDWDTCGSAVGGSNQRYAALARQFNLFVMGVLAALLLAVGAAQAETLRILALGDSLTAGYGLPSKQDAWPALLEAKLRKQGYDVSIHNAGVSGDTTSGGRSRLAWTMAGQKPHAAIVALGANDGLRALPPTLMRQNLDAILTALEKGGATVMLAGMKAPPNMGREYGREYAAAFKEVAKAHDAVFMPFLLDGVAARPELNQEDGIHPNAKGIAIMVDRIAPYVVRLIERTRRK